MSELNIIRLQHGQSNTAANNFTTTAEAANGTMKLLARGNPGATTQDILTVNASGVVDAPQGMTIAGAAGQRMLLTASQATTAGTAIDFTGIPSWAKKVTIIFNSVSTNGSAHIVARIGAGVLAATGYDSTGSAGTAATSATTALYLTANSAAAASSYRGVAELYNHGGNTWVLKGLAATSGNTIVSTVVGSITLGGVLDRLQILTSNGTDTFDAGSVSLLIEGY